MILDLKAIPDKVVKLSDFSFLYSKKFSDYVYHSISMGLYKLSKEQKKIYDQIGPGKRINDLISSDYSTMNNLEFLIKNKIVVSKDVDEQKIYRNFNQNSLGVDFGLMYLLTTDRCNLSCKYCFIENPLLPDHKFSMMSKEIARRGIDLFEKNISKNKNIKKTITFYGGEPLINKEIVHDAVLYIRDKFNSDELSIQLITNGTLVNSEIAKILAENRVNVAISIDGPKSITNKVRPFNEKIKDTYESIKTSWGLLKNAGVENLSISLTISNYNVRDLPENIKKLTEDFHPSSYGFNYLLGKPENLNGCDINISLATEKTIEAFKYLREMGIPEDRMMRKIRAFVQKKPHLKDCGGVGNQLVISSDGYVGPCQAFATSKKYFRPLEELENKNLKEDKIFKKWAKRYPLNLEECIGCLAIGVCGGGCPYQSYLIEGDIKKTDKRMCEHNKIVLNWMIDETINKIENDKS